MGERRDAAHIKGNESDMDGLLNLRSTSETYLPHRNEPHDFALLLEIEYFPIVLWDRECALTVA